MEQDEQAREAEAGRDTPREPGGPPVGGAEPRRGEPPPTGGGRRRRPSPRRYSAGQKLSLIRAYESSGQDMRVFCAEHGLSTASLCTWRRRYRAHGEAGLAGAGNPRNAAGRTRRSFTPEERLAAVLAYQKAGVGQQVFARRWGVSEATLRRWAAAYERGGGLRPAASQAARRRW